MYERKHMGLLGWHNLWGRSFAGRIHATDNTRTALSRLGLSVCAENGMTMNAISPVSQIGTRLFGMCHVDNRHVSTSWIGSHTMAALNDTARASQCYGITPEPTFLPH